MVLSYLMIVLWLNNGSNKQKFQKRKLKQNPILPSQLKERLKEKQKRNLQELFHKRCKKRNSKLKKQKKKNTQP